jgi:cell wall-associated NlpC family hydrolase
MNTAINLLSVIPIRKEPSHRSEMVSQLLFGEYVEIAEEQLGFVKVKCLYDTYEGWVQANQLKNTRDENNKTTNEYTAAYACEVLQNEKTIRVPFGTPIYDVDKYSTAIAGNEIKYLVNPNEVWNAMEYGLTEQNLWSVYNCFLNTPYLWGGKSVFGIDCSGFVQQVFKMFGIKLLRDAYLQAAQGTLVENIDQTKLGDLAFFQNENGKIVHVGIILENNQIVHASGKVRIDTIDEKGIVNKETGMRTHQLHSTRRYF